MKKIIGVFGGSFDPIHFGHINLALQLLEAHHLDEVLFCPVFCSPFKTHAPPVASPEDRLAMLKVALKGIPRFRITSVEIDRGGPSYTIDTIRALQREDCQLRLLLAEDSIPRFDQWKEAEELIRLAPPLVGTRRGGDAVAGSFHKTLKKSFTPTRIMEISSTEIRERLRLGLYCGHLVPEKALDYIQSHQLYSR